MSKLEKEWNLQGWSTKKPDSLAVFYFGLGREGMVSSGVAHFYESPLEMTFKPSRISETTLTSVKYLKRHFFNHPACFFLEQATDDRKIYILFFVLRYPVQCTGLELIPQSLQNKICNRLHPKCTPFVCFPIICSPAIWKLLFSRNRSYLFLISWRKMTECYFSLLATTSATCRLFSCTFHESICIDISKKVYVMLCKLWIWNKNVASSSGHDLWNRSGLPCVVFTLVN